MSQKRASRPSILLRLASALPGWLGWLKPDAPAPPGTHNEKRGVAEPVAQSIAAPIKPDSAPALEVKKVKAPPAPAKPVAPACPHCKKTMVIKVARTGANAGGNFWGCADHPKCRGIRAIFAPLPSKKGGK